MPGLPVVHRLWSPTSAHGHCAPKYWLFVVASMIRFGADPLALGVTVFLPPCHRGTQPQETTPLDKGHLGGVSQTLQLLAFLIHQHICAMNDSGGAEEGKQDEAVGDTCQGDSKCKVSRIPYLETAFWNQLTCNSQY